MKWRDREGSSNVEDRRSQGGFTPGGGGNNLIAYLLYFIFRRFGFKGVLVAGVGLLLLWQVGVINPDSVNNQSSLSNQSSQSKNVNPGEEELFQFVKVVLAGTEEVWHEEFSRIGKTYREPLLIVYRNRTQTACGVGSSQMGPFYCPLDEKVYIDLSFYHELEKTFHAPGDFAQAYVIAHEVGHHVQKLLGTSEKVQAHRNSPDYNQYSVRLELQADYYAGVWANHSKQYLEKGDIEEAMKAANAIGDDAIQKKFQGKVVPHAFTHGTSEQRMRWFNKGLESGRIEDGNTFQGSYNSL